MKIRHTITVEVDPVEWALEYGLEPADVREDVRTYLNSVVDSSYPGDSGLWRRTR